MFEKRKKYLKGMGILMMVLIIIAGVKAVLEDVEPNPLFVVAFAVSVIAAIELACKLAGKIFIWAENRLYRRLLKVKNIDNIFELITGVLYITIFLNWLSILNVIKYGKVTLYVWVAIAQVIMLIVLGSWKRAYDYLEKNAEEKQRELSNWWKKFLFGNDCYVAREIWINQDFLHYYDENTLTCESYKNAEDLEPSDEWIKLAVKAREIHLYGGRAEINVEAALSTSGEIEFIANLSTEELAETFRMIDPEWRKYFEPIN